MKKHVFLFLLAVTALCCPDLYAQVPLYAEDFETDGEGSRYFSNTFNFCYSAPADNPDYFLRTNTNPVAPGGTCSAGFTDALTNLQGDAFWAAEDVRSSSPVPLVNPPGEITTQAFSIAGYYGLSVALYLATSDNTGSRWEDSDSINVQVSIDGGPFQTVGRFMGDSDSGGHLRVDNDLDGAITVGDLLGNCDNTNFAQYGFAIYGTGSTLAVRLDFDQVGDSEEVAIDQIEVYGIAVGPEVGISGNSTPIMAGDVTPSAMDDTDFGGQRVCSGTVVRTYTIENSGPADLTIYGVSITGPSASNYSVTSAPASTVAPGGSTTFDVTFNPSIMGLRKATLTVSNDDSDEGAYKYSIQGIGLDPEMDLRGNNITIADGDMTPSLADFTDFDNMLVCTGVRSRTFTVRNTGNDTLHFTGAMLSGPHASDFSVTAATGAVAAPGDSALFTLEFNPSALGVRNAVLSIMTDDCNENPYDFAMRGTGEADISAPIALCQNVTIYLDASGDASFTAAMLDGGSTDVCGVSGLSTAVTKFTCAEMGANNVTLIVSDGAGNLDSCLAVVTVADTIAPVAICKDLTLYLDASGTVPFSISMAENGSTDNCAVVPDTSAAGILGCNNVGVTNYTLTVADASGNTSTCVSAVTVLDTVPPVALCKDITVYIDGSGKVFFTEVDLDNGSSDACGISTMSLSSGSFTCTEVGPNTVTLTVYDLYGNSSTCTSTVTVMDTIAPVIVCKDVAVALGTGGSVSITPYDLYLSGTDACGIGSITVSDSLFTCADVGAFPDTLTVSDVNGNVSTCVGTVTVSDIIAPVALCKDITVYLKGIGYQTILPSDIDNGSSDGCGIDSLGLSESSFTCADIGLNLVTLTVMDIDSNISTCISNVTVLDTVSPAANCKSITLYLDASGTVGIIPSMVNNYSTDACGIDTMSLSFASVTMTGTFTCSHVGVNVVTLTVTDWNGNSSSCNSNVIIADAIPPVAACQNLTVYLDASGTATIAEDAVENGSTDNCSVSGWDTDITNFGCSMTGANTVVLTVSDPSGNTATCNATITVIDTIAPVVVCHDQIVQLTAAGNAIIDGSMLDGGSTDNCGISSLAVSLGMVTCSDLGMVSITLYATDASGNLDSCVANVEVVDTTGIAGAALDLGPDLHWCPGDMFTLYAGPGFASYLWSEGSTTDSLTVSVPITYSVTVVTAYGCEVSDTVEVLDYILMDGLITTDGPAVLCMDDTLNLMGPAGYTTFEWSTGETTQNISVTASGWYWVYGTDAFGCRQLDSAFVQGFAAPDPNPAITPGGTVTVCGTDPVMLDAGAGYMNYWWSNGDTSRFVSATPGSSYSVVVANSYGCRDSSELVTVVTSDSVDALLTLTAGVIYATPIGTGYTYVWYRDGMLLPGETDPELTPAINGTYKVEITNETGCTGSDTIDILVVGTVETEGSALEVFPNPSNGNITVRAIHAFTGPVTLRVTDMSGKALKEMSMNGLEGEMPLDLTQLAAGVYHLSVQGTGAKANVKLVIQ